MDTEQYGKCSALARINQSKVDICRHTSTQWYIAHGHLIPRCNQHVNQYVSPVYNTLEEGLAALAMERL